MIESIFVLTGIALRFLLAQAVVAVGCCGQYALPGLLLRSYQRSKVKNTVTVSKVIFAFHG